ncbi:related to SYF2-pre-mRNA-splicing factor [Sporisorium reilianum f. sp. reilianum]|uniref:Pre-mRNA-splicing factor SYF2 n=1 Tax=Sporisorium reilianum f. sp. reilianum TaxID=72559 RepID=A0A2N8U6G7_9BASI|nr:related to SYF2-pre-mRNA-splicing factor [Sporisorium reilianum f. sp. reilianum]
MPPRRSRAQKADEQQDATSVAASAAEPSTSTTSDAVKLEDAAAPSTSTKPKSKSRAARHQPLVLEQPAPEPSPAEESEAPIDPEASASSSKPTMEERQERLSLLRAKMAASTRANRRDILSEQSRARTLASASKSSTSRKLQKAEQLLEERDLRESGEDVERHRNMGYSLEDSERWDAKLEEKERRKDRGPGDFGDAAERAYQRQLRVLKPDVAAYRKRRDDEERVKASGPAGGALVRSGSAARGAVDELHYGTHRPSDDALDRVVNHLNHEKQLIQNRSRRRNDEPDAEVNYINDANRHFNKKLKRFYDKQTQEIRENLERGTAL